MTDAPERIWATAPHLGVLRPTEYIRADLAPTREQKTKCCVCAAPVDTREENEGGDPDGCELRNGEWVCSLECWYAVKNVG